MIKKVLSIFVVFSIFANLFFIEQSSAITAEERLIEVEKQLQAIAEQIDKYEGERSDLEKAIIANNADLKKVNSDLSCGSSKTQCSRKRT